MRKGSGNQTTLGEVLEGVLKRAGLQNRVKQGRVMLAWKEIVGPANARHSWPLKVRDGVLLVACSSAAWAQTLTMLREQILQKAARLLGDCPLRDIHFLGTGLPGESRSAAEAGEKLLPAKIPLPVEECAWIRDLTKDISEPTLRKKAEAALGSLLRQRKWHHAQGNRPCASCGRLHRASGPFCPTCRSKRQT